MSTQPFDPDLLTPAEVDEALRYPAGRAKRLARSGRLPSIILPDGEVRFPRTEIENLLRRPCK